MSETVESVYIFCFCFYVILVLCHTFIYIQGKSVLSACFWTSKKEFTLINKMMIAPPFITASCGLRAVMEYFLS